LPPSAPELRKRPSTAARPGGEIAADPFALRPLILRARLVLGQRRRRPNGSQRSTRLHELCNYSIRGRRGVPASLSGAGFSKNFASPLLRISRSLTVEEVAARLRRLHAHDPPALHLRRNCITSASAQASHPRSGPRRVLGPVALLLGLKPLQQIPRDSTTTPRPFGKVPALPVTSTVALPDNATSMKGNHPVGSCTTLALVATRPVGLELPRDLATSTGVERKTRTRQDLPRTRPGFRCIDEQLELGPPDQCEHQAGAPVGFKKAETRTVRIETIRSILELTLGAACARAALISASDVLRREPVQPARLRVLRARRRAAKTLRGTSRRPNAFRRARARR